MRERLLAFLRSGATPEKLAQCVAVAMTVGVFPVLGSTTLLCFLAGLALRLNPVAIQVVNQLAYPFQLALFIPFIRLGERLAGAPPASLSLSAVYAQFTASPMVLAKTLGVATGHGVLGWAATAPFVLATCYYGSLPLLRRLPPFPVRETT